MSDTNFEPYATKADLQELLGDLIDRIARLEGQLINPPPPGFGIHGATLDDT